MNEAQNPELENILSRVKSCPIKGRLYIYEQFKGEVQRLNLPPYHFEDACRKIANILEV